MYKLEGDDGAKLAVEGDDLVQLKADLKLWDDLTYDPSQVNLIIKGPRREALLRMLAVVRAVLP